MSKAKKKPTHDHAASQRKYSERMREQKFKRVATWVPEEEVDDFKKTVDRKRKKWRQPEQATGPA